MVDTDASQLKEDQLNNKISNEEYKIWKKQSPFLYDLCLSKASEARSFTVQWYPDTPEYTKTVGPITTYSLLMATGVDREEPNGLIYRALVDIPNSNYSGGAKIENIVAPVQEIRHPGESNRARYAPKNPKLVASMSSLGSAYIFDMSKAPSTPTEQPAPTLTLDHHSKEGFGLSWSNIEENVLATGSQDGTVAIWDIAGGNNKPVHVFDDNAPADVNDVSFSYEHPYLLAAGSENRVLTIYDRRGTDFLKTKSSNARSGHSQGVNAVAFSPHNPTMVATGGADRNLMIWDIRNLQEPQAILQGHSQDIVCVKWSPHDKSVLASGGTDRRVKIWDISRLDSSADESEGAPELIFIHGGHSSRVSDIDWHPTMPWTIASVSEDNIIQVWKVAGAIVDGNSDDEEKENDDAEA